MVRYVVREPFGSDEISYSGPDEAYALDSLRGSERRMDTLSLNLETGEYTFKNSIWRRKGPVFGDKFVIRKDIFDALLVNPVVVSSDSRVREYTEPREILYQGQDSTAAEGLIVGREGRVELYTLGKGGENSFSWLFQRRVFTGPKDKKRCYGPKNFWIPENALEALLKLGPQGQ